MTGYIVKENDDLWSIAKSHHTTSESILALNDLTEENLTVGTHLRKDGELLQFGCDGVDRVRGDIVDFN